MKILSHRLGEDEIHGFLKTYKNSFLISCYKGKPAQRVETGKKKKKMIVLNYIVLYSPLSILIVNVLC